jgi:DNA-binding transcriptional MocR family regulator
MKRGPHVLDPYVLDTLMADLVGHDHRPSAFLVYLAIIAAASDGGRAALSHAALAERTGLSRRTVQSAIAALRRRSLIETLRGGPTETPEYRPLSPWRREAMS